MTDWLGNSEQVEGEKWSVRKRQATYEIICSYKILMGNISETPRSEYKNIHAH